MTPKSLVDKNCASIFPSQVCLGLCAELNYGADLGSISILNLCSSLPGVPDRWGLQLCNYSIDSNMPGKLNHAQSKYFKLF